MADTVARLAQIYAVLFGNRGDIAVIVRVFKAGLQGVMVDIGDAFFGFDTGNAHGLKLQVGHGAGGILRKGLIDTDSNLTAGHKLARYQMRG